jgi:hypothetical protein
VEDPTGGRRLGPGGEAAAESNSEATMETNRRIAPKIAPKSKTERRRARDNGRVKPVRLTRWGPMGEGSTNFRLTTERAKCASGANRVVPVLAQRARCSAQARH